MNTEEIREARKEAQRQLQDVLSSFHAATGLRIHKIDVCSVSRGAAGRPRAPRGGFAVRARQA